MRDIFLVIHAEATHHRDDLVGGWFDSALTDHGLVQAEAIAYRLSETVADDAVEIFSSDLRRAAETATPIARRLRADVHETAALREISYGVAGGQSKAWFDQRYVPAPDEDRLDHRGSIEGAESRRDVAKRVYPFVDSLLLRPTKTAILVTHGFTAGIVIAAWMRVPVEAVGFMSFPTASASITHLREDDFFRNRALVSFNDTAHLR